MSKQIVFDVQHLLAGCDVHVYICEVDDDRLLSVNAHAMLQQW